MEHVSHFFFSIIDHAGYPGLFAVMVLANMGIPVGAEIVVPAAGALAATGHLSSAWLTALVATLGELVGGSRESVNKHLQDWRRSGLIEVEKGSILIRDVEALAELG